MSMEQSEIRQIPPPKKKTKQRKETPNERTKGIKETQLVRYDRIIRLQFPQETQNAKES